MSLTQNQIDEITAARDQALATGGTSGAATYYTAIAQFFPYGTLAASVQNPTSWASIVANTYAQNKLVHDLGLTYSAADQEAIRLGLIERDYSARTNANWNDITQDDIATYHNLVFANVYLNNAHAKEAWTPYNIIQTLGTNYDWMTATLTHYAETYFAMIGHQLFGNPADANYGNAFDWVQDMRVGYVIDWRNYSVVKGDGVWATATGQYFVDHVTPIADLFVPISSTGASAENPFYSDAIEGLFIDAVMRSSDPAVLSQFATAGSGTISVNIVGADAAAPDATGWLNTMLAGEKLSLIGTFDQANWNHLEQSDPGYAHAFSLLDAFTPSEFVFQTTGSAVSASGSDPSVLLGGAGFAEFYAGGGGTAILAGRGSDRLHDGSGQDLLFGGAGADYVISAAGGDVVDGGAGNDVIDATQVPQSWNIDGTLVDGATVLFRQGSGHDVIQVATQHVDLGGGFGYDLSVSGINKIQFDGLNSDDVTLYWDATKTGTSGAPESSFYSETWEGDAAIVLKDSGDSIFVGPVTGYETVMDGVTSYSLGTDTGFVYLAFEDQSVVDWTQLFTIDHNVTLGPLPSAFTSAPSDYTNGALIS